MLRILLLSLIFIQPSISSFLPGQCSPRSCLNGGICHPGREHNEHWCRCPEGFEGSRCDVHSCPEVCQNGGKCLRSSALDSDSILCQCAPGYKGRYCELTADSVCSRQSPCGLNGRCHLNSSNEDYYCNCKKGWTGPNCEIKESCPVGFCLNGGRCNSSNGCDCPSTFKGKRCEHDVDECEKLPCLNGAECRNTRGSFECVCPAGFDGPLCEMQSRSRNCSKTPCQNGGFCDKNQAKGEEYCICPPMYQGLFCELDVNECDVSPCQNSGTCVNQNGGYQCFCPAGFAGVNCELNIDDCASDPCSAGSTCTDGVDTYSCVCPSGKVGLHCELEDKCSSNPCLNGRCESLQSTGEYSCTCESGFTGSHCEFDIDECAQSEDVCLNNGTCVNTAGGFHCECKPPLTGSRCDSIMEACASSPCLNHGTCVDRFTSFTCICLEGFSGTNCEKFEASCPQRKCQNGGICDIGVCICPKGTRGQFCEKKMTVCGMETCESPRECKIGSDGSSSHCDCPSGYFGPNCDQRLSMESCLDNPCLHGGNCSDTEKGYECRCPKGYMGQQCEKSVDFCSSSPCNNGGSCVHDANGFKCICNTSFQGETCESKVQPCASNFCGRNGRCIKSDGSAVCSCNPGFTGDKCQQDIDECASSPCQNGGFCENLIGGYSCRCKHPHWGKNCENGVDWCRKNPCHNNGSCITAAHDFYCDCHPGFSGKVCNQNTNGCSPNSCQNSGVCIPDSSSGFSCFCPAGFSGKQCQINEDDCKTNSCLNGGRCIDGINSFSCSCSRGFFGSNCESFVDLSQNRPIHARDMATCTSNSCGRKSKDGICNQECNFFACEYDGGDCSAATKPFEKCEYAEYCSLSFANGRCDPICNNESCLFDGRDCDSLPLTCPHWEYCSKTKNNGVCDLECNTLACGYDEDCRAPEERRLLNGTLDVVILGSPNEFLPKLNDFLLNMTLKLRVSVNLKSDDIGPLIFKWKDHAVVERLQVNQDTALYMGYNTRSRRSAGLEGIFLTLQLDAGYCSQNCFSDMENVANFVGRTVASEDPESADIRIYEAKAIHSEEGPPTKETSSSWGKYLLGALIVIGIAFGVIGVADKVNPRKRRSLEAPVYIPPTEQEYKQTLAQQASNSMQYHFFPPMFNNIKRTKLDTPYYHTETSIKVPDLPIPLGRIIPMKPQQKVIYPELSEIHQEASSSDNIKLPISVEKVNEKVGLNGRTPLHYVVSNPIKSTERALKDIENLYKAGANLDVQDEDQETPLFMASRYQKSSLVAKLLELGSKPTVMNKFYSSCLHQAAHNSDLKTTEELLKLKAVRDEINEVDFFDRTALMVSAMEDWRSHEVAEKLINAGADPSYAGDKDASTRYRGRTALHYAALYGNIHMIKFLVEKGANKDAQDREECTALFLAAQEGKIDSVKMLVECGASQEITDQKEFTPLHIAQERSHNDIAAYLAARKDTVVVLPRNVASRPQIKATKGPKKYNRRKCHPLTPPDSDEAASTPSPPTTQSNYNPCQALLDSPKSDEHKDTEDKYSPQGIDINNTSNAYLWQNNSGSSYSFSSPSYTESQPDTASFGNSCYSNFGGGHFDSFNVYSNPNAFPLSSCQHKNDTKPTFLH